jgi:hypothetical protein
LDHFITWLEIRGYRRASIRRHSREPHRFAIWAQAEGLTVADLDPDTLHRFQSHAFMQTTEMYLHADPMEKIEAIEDAVPPSLRPGRFTVPGKLIASLHGKVL